MIDTVKICKLLDMNETEFAEIFKEIHYPWEVLPRIEDFIFNIASELPSHYTAAGENIWVGKGTTIAENAQIEGPVIIGCNCEIRHNAFIRGKAVIGNNCVIGNSTEVKNSFLFNNVQAPHFNYVGDSIMGYKSHIGAGVILSNVKSIPGNVVVKVGEEVIETGLRKFSAVLGDKAEVGCNSVLNPGTVVGRGSVIYPLSNVRGVVPSNYIFKNGVLTEIIQK